MYFALAAAGDNLAPAARTTAAIATLIGILWITEALPLAATSLLPLVLFPLCGVLTFEEAARPFADYLVFVYLGGFMLALAIERWNLHRRLALLTLLVVGTQPARLVGGLMLATAFVSMWISNTATTAMMLPLGLSLVALITEQARAHTTTLGDRDAGNFATAMMLGIAYAATIGGLGTLIGTPTNIALAGFARSQGLTLGFARWMLFALPLVAAYLLATWLLLTKLHFRLPRLTVPAAGELIRRELAELGRLSRGELVVLVVFLLTALLWIVREPLVSWPWLVERWPAVASLNDGMIALAGAIVLFAIPIDTRQGVFALDWKTASKLPWGVLLLFGGGLSLAAAITKSKLAEAMGLGIAAAAASMKSQFGGTPGDEEAWQTIAPLVVVVLVTLTVIFASEFTSNVATVTAFLPIMLGVSQGLGSDPLLLVVSTGVAASCAFMLPVGTPPNAIAFGTGYVRQSQMMKAGLWLNLLGVILIPLAVYTLGVWVLGIKPY
jgi:sodium-dependent dicarboxylate transporter 2/3/5